MFLQIFSLHYSSLKFHLCVVIILFKIYICVSLFYLFANLLYPIWLTQLPAILSTPIYLFWLNFVKGTLRSFRRRPRHSFHEGPISPSSWSCLFPEQSLEIFLSTYGVSPDYWKKILDLNTRNLRILITTSSNLFYMDIWVCLHSWIYCPVLFSFNSLSTTHRWILSRDRRWLEPRHSSFNTVWLN